MYNLQELESLYLPRTRWPRVWLVRQPQAHAHPVAAARLLAEGAEDLTIDV